MRSYRLILVTLGLCLAGRAFGQTSSVQEGFRLFEQGQYEAALREFEDANRARPNNPALENIIGVTYSKLGRIDQADAHYREAIHLNPKLASPHKNLGFNYLGEKRYGEAEKQLKIALELDASDQFAHYYLGMVYLADARDKDAVEQLNGVPSLLDNDPDTAFQFVMACLRVDRSSEAEASLARLERRSTLSAQQQYQLAVLFSDERMYAEALDRFERLDRMNPRSGANQFNLAVAYLNAQKPDEAIRTLEHLRAEHPDDAATLSLLGLAYENAQKVPQALDAYRRALTSEPRNPDRYLDYTRLLMDLNRLDESAQVILRGLNAVNDKYPLYIRLGSIELQRGDFAEARKSFRAAVDLHPEMGLAYVAMAKSYLLEGNNAQAEAILIDARRKIAEDFMLDYFYGLTLERLAKDREAVDVLESAIRLNQNVPEPHYELGKAYLALGRLDQARGEFERVIQLAPEHANAHYQLSRLYAKLGDSQRAREMANETKRLKQGQLDEAIEIQRTRLGQFQPVETAAGEKQTANPTAQRVPH